MIGLVDELSEAHLVTLDFLDDPVANFRRRGLRDGSPGTTRQDYVSQLLEVADTDLVNRVLRDLDQRELSNNSGYIP